MIAAGHDVLSWAVRFGLLIEQDRIEVELFQRGEAWRSAAYNELGAVLPLISVPVQLPLSEIYREVFSPVA
jgi:hypothetical protein